VRPVFNRPPHSTKGQRFDSSEFKGAPYWDEIWESIAQLVDNKLLIAYNASFDCRALAAECARRRLKSNDLGWRCAMQLVKRVVGTKKNWYCCRNCISVIIRFPVRPARFRNHTREAE
jgi:DNA polymerase III epsilon subunit-like protein